MENLIMSFISFNFISFDDSNEVCILHTKSDNVEIMMGDKTDDILKNLLNLFCKNIKKD